MSSNWGSEETSGLKKRMRDEPNFQILGFRFEEDLVSPAERFATLRTEFGDRFLDGTIPYALYHCRDGLPPHAHSVLTECLPSTNPAPSVAHAWSECLGFLAAKLRGTEEVRYRFRHYSGSLGGRHANGSRLAGDLIVGGDNIESRDHIQ